uniref:Vicilin-like antimicrobial peptides 2-2 n=1 Tax=Anthurium amnicola TaxID=1678845 RepID=A0A1D1ZK97_9ARAE
MGARWEALLLVLLVASWAVAVVSGYDEQREGEEAGGEEFGHHHRGGGEQKAGLFILEKSKQVVKTEAGGGRGVKGFRGRGSPSPMHIGFVSMEPNSLLIPQYMDASLILFVRRGEAKVGWIYKDRLVERQLKMGDIYRISAGSTYYIVNTGKAQRLQMICSIDTSESLGSDVFQSFFIGGGSNPTPVLAGFDTHTLTNAFNVTSDVLNSIMKQGRGPIVYMKGDAAEQARRLPSTLLPSKKNPTHEEDGDKEVKTWSWRKLLDLFVWKEAEEDHHRSSSINSNVDSPNPYNLFDRNPDFKNDYGWSLALDEGEYPPLRHSGVGVYLVNLTAGAMMAPHVNPSAAEFGVVLSGEGRVQVVFPNGSSAMDAEVKAGDAFWVPRYFPFCQVASRGGPMEFFGFTTSARRNRPQFLVGASSVLRTMMGPELAAAFGTSEERLRKVVELQKESAILPAWPRPAKGEEEQEKKEKGEGESLLFGRATA